MTTYFDGKGCLCELFIVLVLDFMLCSQQFEFPLSSPMNDLSGRLFLVIPRVLLKSFYYFVLLNVSLYHQRSFFLILKEIELVYLTLNIRTKWLLSSCLNTTLSLRVFPSSFNRIRHRNTP